MSTTVQKVLLTCAFLLAAFAVVASVHITKFGSNSLATSILFKGSQPICYLPSEIDEAKAIKPSLEADLSTEVVTNSAIAAEISGYERQLKNIDQELAQKIVQLGSAQQSVTSFTAQIKKLEATLKSSKKNTAKYRTTLSSLQKAQNSLKSTQALVDKIKKEEDTLKNSKTEVVSRIDDARNRFNESENALNELKDELNAVAELLVRMQSNVCPREETSCDDGVDNERDGNADCADSACSTEAVCKPQDLTPEEIALENAEDTKAEENPDKLTEELVEEVEDEKIDDDVCEISDDSSLEDQLAALREEADRISREKQQLIDEQQPYLNTVEALESSYNQLITNAEAINDPNVDSIRDEYFAEVKPILRQIKLLQDAVGNLDKQSASIEEKITSLIQQMAEESEGC